MANKKIIRAAATKGVSQRCERDSWSAGERDRAGAPERVGQLINLMALRMSNSANP